MISRHNFRRNNKGIGTVFGMVFFILIVMIVIASLIVILNQNTGLQQTTTQANQQDLNRYTELQTVSISNPAEAPGTNTVYVECNIADNGPLSAQLDRLWIKDTTTNLTVNTPVSIVLNAGSTTPYFNAINFPNMVLTSSDLFNFWFITARGNAISASPSANQLNTGSNGALVENSTASPPSGSSSIQFSLTTKSPNNLIYLAVFFDDSGAVTPTSNPVLTWTVRGKSSSTDAHGGDSFLETWYAIMPSSGTISISLSQTNSEGDWYWAAMAFAVGGVNTTSPFESTAPVISIGDNNGGAQPSASITTTNSHDLMVGALGIDWPTPAITPGTGFSQVMGAENSNGASQAQGETTAPRSVWMETMVTNKTTANLSLNAAFTPQDPWAFIADAVKLNTPSYNTLTLSPTSGPVGQTFAVSGSGFAANSQLLATFAGSTVPFNFITTASGTIPAGATITVPAGSTSGNKQVEVIDSKFNYANGTFTVNSAGITVSPPSGAVGTSVTVTGSYFVSSSTVTLDLNGNPVTTTPSTVTTNAAGGFSATFAAAGNAGVQIVSASDGVNSANTVFTITSSITITPASGPPGTQVTVSGSGFAAGSILSATFAGSGVILTGTTITDATGSFSGSMFTIPASTTGSDPVVFSDSATPTPNTGTGSFTVNAPTLTLNPTSGNVGSSVTVSGSNYIPGSTVTVKFDALTMLTFGATATGTLPATGNTFVVPTTASGSHTVSASDGTNTGTASFTVNGPTLTLNPTSGNVGVSVAVSGSNYVPGAIVTVKFDSITEFTFSATGAGALPGTGNTFVVPTATSGSHTVSASDGTNTGTASFTVNGPTLTLNPTSGPKGTTVAVSGSGYVPSATVTVQFDSGTVLSVTATATGALPATGNTFAVPTTASAGSNSVSATDGTNPATPQTFTVTTPSISLSPTTGPVGTPVTVTGSNFLPGSTVTITFNAVGVTTNPSKVTASGTGTISASFTVPTSTTGVKTVTATDSATNSASATFTVVTPSISLSPTTGPVGTSVTVTGSNFVPTSTVTIQFNGVKMTTNPPTIVALGGGFSASFTVPSSAAGAQTVTATDTVNTASATFTVYTLPSGVLHSVPITLTNSQSSAVLSGSQVNINVDWNTYSSYLSNPVDNYAFFDSSGNVLPSWLESASATTTSGVGGASNTATSSVVWVVIDSQIPANGGTYTFYLGFYATTSNQLSSTGNTGEAPTLSNTYAAYDNGANVFNAYFNGNTATSSFSVSSGYTLTQATGIAGPGSSTINAIKVTGYGGKPVFTFNKAMSNTALVVESSFSDPGAANPGTDTGAVGIVNNVAAASVTNAISAASGGGKDYFEQDSWINSAFSASNSQGTATANWLYASLTYTGSSATSWSAYIAPQLYSTTGGYTGTVTNNPLSSATNLYLGQISSSSSGYPITIYYNFMRARTYLPNGATPTASFGSFM
jgi:hypothetical protein